MLQTRGGGRTVSLVDLRGGGAQRCHLQTLMVSMLAKEF